MQSEPSDGSEKLQTVAKVLRDFKAAYNQHRCDGMSLRVTSIGLRQVQMSEQLC